MDTIKPIQITFDPAKNAANVRERGLPFSLVGDEFEWSSASVIEDLRTDYGETRYTAVGFIGQRLHVVIFTPRNGATHVISLRKANRREEKIHAAQAKS